MKGKLAFAVRRIMSSLISLLSLLTSVTGVILVPFRVKSLFKRKLLLGIYCFSVKKN